MKILLCFILNKKTNERKYEQNVYVHRYFRKYFDKVAIRKFLKSWKFEYF